MPPWEKYKAAAPEASGPWAKYAQPKSLMQAAFPGAHADLAPKEVLQPWGNIPGQKPLTRTMSSAEQSVLPGVMDVLTLPARAAGATAGSLGYSGATGGPKTFKEGLADPETGLARPVRESLGKTVAERWAGGQDGKRGIGDIAMAGAAGLGYLGASIAEDPAALLGGAAGVAPKAVGKFAQKTVAPIKGAAQKLRQGTANAAEAGANKIQNTIIRPRQMDEAAGFKIENVSKYGVDGSIDEVIGKSQSKIEEAATNLKALIKAGKDNGARVDLNKAVSEVEQEIFKGRAKEFANLKESPAALKDLRERIALLTDEVGPSGRVDLVEAQYVKQALGDMGAFEHVAGKQGVQISKEDRTLSQIASRVYLKLKDQIEAVAPDGVKEQNRIMSDLIPVNRSALYRKLVADRNNVVSMSDMLGAMATIGGGPKGLALWAASRASKSGNTAKVLYSTAKALRAAKSPAEAQFYSKALQRLGATAAEIETIQTVSGAASAAQSNVIPFRQMAEPAPADNTIARGP